MSLRDNVIALCRAPYAYTMVEGDTRTPAEVRADAIIALVQAHMTSDEAGKRGRAAAHWKNVGLGAAEEVVWKAAILAALEGDQ